MKVWDVGANVGLFSLAAAHLAGASGSILAIEPDPWLASLLIRSAQTPARGAAPIQVLAAPVSDHQAIAVLHVAKRGRASNFIGTGREESGGERYSMPVSTVTLDSLLETFPVPDLLKIDIEGMEYLALKGARQILMHRPVIFAEVAEPNRNAVEELLSGYRFLFTNMQTAPHVPNNLIAVPQ
jgi:FkbM family methyltransferase